MLREALGDQTVYRLLHIGCIYRKTAHTQLIHSSYTPDIGRKMYVTVDIGLKRQQSTIYDLCTYE
jgi:hypothetical protein